MALIETLCKTIFSIESANVYRTRAMLCSIYHNALHDNWFKARDAILMSHFQETIMSTDIATNVRLPLTDAC